ncbi:MAG: hypothetical protein HY815_06815 [Candidatus Riflebacteria bacterium]|nr:hypothetical protein [Candidatus Riflebacteria bacterium]
MGNEDVLLELVRSRGLAEALAADGALSLVQGWEAVVESIVAGYDRNAGDYLKAMDLRQVLEESLGLLDVACVSKVA